MRAAVVFLCIAAIAVVLSLVGPGLYAHWLFGITFGWILHRAGFCFVAAVRDPVLTGSTALARAVIVSIAIATFGFSIITIYTGETGTVAPLGWNTVLGGLVFGTGMVIAGGCVSGTLMRMGDGFVMQWLAFAGLLAGSLIGTRAGCLWSADLFGPTTRVFLPHHLGWSGALALQYLALIGLWLLALRWENRCFAQVPGRSEPAEISNTEEPEEADLDWLDAGWVEIGAAETEAPDAAGSSLGGFLRRARAGVKSSLKGLLTDSVTPAVGGVLLGIAATAYFATVGRPWGITTELTYWASGVWRLLGQHPEEWPCFLASSRGIPSDLRIFTHPGTALNLGTICGAFFASFVADQWRLRLIKNWRLGVAALAGGTMMGYGSRLSMGCNIGALFSGTSSLSLHGWVYLVSLVAGGTVGVYLARILLFNPAVKTTTSRKQAGLS